MNVLRGLHYLLIGVAWASISSSAILVVGSGESAIKCAFWRLTLSLPVIYGLSVITGGWRKPINRRVFLASFTAGFFLALHFLTWMESLFIISIPLSTTLVVTYPLISALVESLMKEGTVKKQGILGLSVSFIGVLITLSPTVSSSKDLFGASLALIGAGLAAGYFLLGKYSRESLNVFEYASITYSTASATLLLYSLVVSASLIPGKPVGWVFMTALALIPMLGGHTVMNYLIKFMPAHVVSSIALGEPAGASLLASLIFNQFPEPAVIVGMALTVVGEYILIRAYPGLLA